MGNVAFLLVASDAVTGVPSIFINSWPSTKHIPRFLEREKVCGSTKSHSRKRTVTTSTDEGTESTHTHRKTEGTPNTLHHRNVAEVLENFTGHTIQTPCFTISLSHCASLFPLLLSSRLASSFSLPLLFFTFPRPPATNC